MIRTAIDEIVVLRRQNDVLSERVAYLEGQLAIMGDDCPAEWKLSKSEARVMGLLLRASGALVRRRTLVSAVWDMDEPETADRMLDIFIYKIRKKVALSSVKIVTLKGVGFRTNQAPANLATEQ